MYISLEPGEFKLRDDVEFKFIPFNNARPLQCKNKGYFLTQRAKNMGSSVNFKYFFAGISYNFQNSYTQSSD